MKRWGIITVIGPMLILAGCWGGNTWNQKLTVTIMTPNGEVSGSSVTRTKLQFAEDTWLTAGSQYQGNYGGEAVIVELAPNKYLFAPTDERLITLVLKVFIDPYAAASPKKEQANQVEAMRAKKTLAADDYPKLVTFTDINDPKSVKLVDAANLAATFGTGYRLKSITLEITDEPETKGKAEQVLPWLKTVTSNLDGSKYSSPQLGLSNNINVGNFSTER
jgi:hypothetical protein